MHIDVVDAIREIGVPNVVVVHKHNVDLMDFLPPRQSFGSSEVSGVSGIFMRGRALQRGMILRGALRKHDVVLAAHLADATPGEC